MNMKKLLLIMTVFLLLASCSSNGHTANGDINDTCHFEQYFHKFMARYPDGLNNDVKKEEMNKQFVSEITDSLKSSEWLLEDYPLQFGSIAKQNEQTCNVHFQGWIRPNGFKFKDFNFNDLGFDIVGKVPIKYVDVLKEDNFYIVHGKLKRFLKQSEYVEYTNQMPYTPEVCIEKELGVNRINWLLGEMLFDIDSISEYKPIP